MSRVTHGPGHVGGESSITQLRTRSGACDWTTRPIDFSPVTLSHGPCWKDTIAPEKGTYCSVGREFQFGKMKKSSGNQWEIVKQQYEYEGTSLNLWKN